MFDLEDDGVTKKIPKISDYLNTTGDEETIVELVTPTKVRGRPIGAKTSTSKRKTRLAKKTV